MEFNNLVLEVNDGLAVLTINRPDKLNALNNEVMREIKAAFEHIRREPTSLRFTRLTRPRARISLRKAMTSSRSSKSCPSLLSQR